MFDKVRYAADEIRENGASRTWWKNRFLHRFVGGVWFRHVVGNRGEYVVQKDWDNLLVLDACRLDLYRAVVDADCDAMRSRGAATPEWVAENFEGRSFPEIVYVTANPYVSILTDDEFHARIDLWEDAWDDEEATVLPADLAERTREVAEEYPNKRLIVHFMQPHQPFIDWDLPGSFWNVSESPWDALKDGTVDEETILEGYVDNLRIAYPVARDLGLELPGKSVITADHGNMLGERVTPFPIRDYGHRKGLYTDENVLVPWDELPYDSRKEITAEGTGQSDDDRREIAADVTDRLADLGYTE